MMEVLEEFYHIFTSCLANNSELSFTAKGSILGDALHPGWETIKLREAQWNRVPETPTSPEHQEPPMFTKHLESFERLQVSAARNTSTGFCSIRTKIVRQHYE